MLRFIFVFTVALCIPISIVLLVMSVRRVRLVVSGLFSLYAVLTFMENPFRSLIIFGVLWIINGTIKDIKRKINRVKESESFYDPKPKYDDDTQYIRAKIIDSEDYYEEVNSKEMIKL